MPNARTHDAAGVWMAIPATAVGYWWAGYAGVSLFCGGHLLTTFLLSPDLDHTAGSYAYRRWWCLRWIWYPYCRLVAHGSWLSHWPLIGTAFRVAYLVGIVAALATLAWLGCLLLQQTGVGVSTAWYDWRPVVSWSRAYRSEARVLLGGLEFGAAVHYVLDWATTNVD